MRWDEHVTVRFGTKIVPVFRKRTPVFLWFVRAGRLPEIGPVVHIAFVSVRLAKIGNRFKQLITKRLILGNNEQADRGFR